MFDIKKYRSIYKVPEGLINDSSWKEHIPFAFFLVEILKPEIFVELGVFKGGSYNAFCQAVKETGTGTKCYGVDSWEGDKHSGFYDISIYNDLLKYQQKHFKNFSTMLKMPFDDAVERFANEGIDLLHIDGYHTYEAVKHDFEGWLPKMSKKGVIVFHDTNFKDFDFGVWKLWEEMSLKYPSFEFKHGCGLGVLAVGKEVNDDFLAFISEANRGHFYSDLFSKLGRSISQQTGSGQR